MAFADMNDKRIPQPDPIAAQDPKFIRSFEQWTLDKPHPGYGKDPNIINYLGHTRYPKLVTIADGSQVVANNEEEEKALLNNDPETNNQEPIQLRDDGPTIEEYTARGFDPNNYPPKGYAKKSSDEEIAAAIAAHNKSGW